MELTMPTPAFFLAVVSALLAYHVYGAPTPGDIVCRYEATTPADVNYYTCTELALKYFITVEKFFELNPSLDKDCETIKPKTVYCVKGWKQPPLANDGLCGLPYNNASCAGLDKQCCNGETWTCGDQETDCEAGTCFSGACAGFPNQFSMDGKCGIQHRNLECGGKWGSCCDITGQCGTGEDFCGVGKCQSGNCTIIIPPPPSGSNPDPTPGNISPDGSCGGSNGFVCKGSRFGDCCSSSGFCGATSAHCSAGCQIAFGSCTNPSLSPDGTCGGNNKYQCKGSSFGDCCSSSGYCGSTAAYCTAGCQSAFGTCTSTDLSPDGTCGGAKGYKCKGSAFGDCCSSAGYCGSTNAHCGADCQQNFGTCLAATATSQAPAPTGISTDGRCGGSAGLKCQGSGFGNCCSANGYCGSTVNHCAQGCQNAFSSACITSNIPSLDGSCGSGKGFTCAGGPFDKQCCSSSGFCGTTDNHCKIGCQINYGTCK